MPLLTELGRKLPRALLFFAFFIVLSLPLQAASTPQPPAIAFVIHHRGITLTKHPAKPILYMTCAAALESKNLVSLQLDANGNVLKNTAQSFNFFDSNPTNQPFQHALVRPALLTKEGILYLAVQPDYPAYLANTKHQEIAAIALDVDGQPTEVRRAFRTSRTGQGLRTLQWEPTTRRLFVSYNLHFGWLGVGKDGLPEKETHHAVDGVYECWNWVFEPVWQRFYARQTRSNAGLTLFKLSANGLSSEWAQNAGIHSRGDYHVAVSPEFRRAYYLDRGTSSRLASFQLTEEGRLTGVPRYHALHDAIGMRFDFARQRLYAWSPDAILRTYSLNDRGLPVGDPGVQALGCGEIRDLIVDAGSGRIYVLGTQPSSAT
jgi:hypothetical protein